MKQSVGKPGRLASAQSVRTPLRRNASGIAENISVGISRGGVSRYIIAWFHPSCPIWCTLEGLRGYDLYSILTSPTLCSLLKTPTPFGITTSTALSPIHFAMTSGLSEIAKNAGFFSGENGPRTGAMLAWVLNPTVAPHSFPKITIDLLPSGEIIELRTTALHPPKALMR